MHKLDSHWGHRGGMLDQPRSSPPPDGIGSGHAGLGSPADGHDLEVERRHGLAPLVVPLAAGAPLHRRHDHRCRTGGRGAARGRRPRRPRGAAGPGPGRRVPHGGSHDSRQERASTPFTRSAFAYLLNGYLRIRSTELNKRDVAMMSLCGRPSDDPGIAQPCSIAPLGGVARCG